MLSIIISSYNADLFAAIEKNIAATIGISYEIIKIENPGLMGLCEAYNRGANAAKYSNLLFVHEDVEFITENWGGILLELLDQENVGIVGVLGSDYVPNVPFAWWDLHENNFSHYVQYEENILIGDYNLSSDKNVYVIDGVFMALKRTIFNKFKFDERIKGFHAYDVKFSITVANEHQNLVTSKIKLAHFSYAVNTLDKTWLDSLIVIRPLYNIPKGQVLNKKNELYSFLKFYGYLKKFNYPKNTVLTLLFKYAKVSSIGFRGAVKAYKLIITELLK